MTAHHGVALLLGVCLVLGWRVYQLSAECRSWKQIADTYYQQLYILGGFGLRGGPR
jgi:hypothetical protein